MKAPGATATVVIATAVGAMAPTAGATSEPVWTLRSLGQPALQLPVDQPVGERAVSFDAPDGTRQGAGRWYLGRLHFTLELDPSSGPGLVYLSLLTNEHAAILVKFTTSHRHGRLRVEWNTVDLLHGRREHTTGSASITSSAMNFVQDHGLRSGSNTLAFQLERYGHARVRAVTVHDDSGVIGSRRGPAHVRLEVPVHDRQLQVGDTFSIPYVVRSTGDRRPERVSITADYDERALEAVGATTRQLDPRARTTRGEFGFRARRAGSTHVLLTVKSTANRPGAEVAVRIDPAAAGGGGSGWWAALGALGLVLVAAAATIELVPRIQARRGTA